MKGNFEILKQQAQAAQITNKLFAVHQRRRAAPPHKQTIRSSFAERNIPTEAHSQRALMALRAMSLSARCVLARTVDMFLFPLKATQ